MFSAHASYTRLEQIDVIIIILLRKKTATPFVISSGFPDFWQLLTLSLVSDQETVVTVPPEIIILLHYMHTYCCCTVMSSGFPDFWQLLTLSLVSDQETVYYTCLMYCIHIHTSCCWTHSITLVEGTSASASDSTLKPGPPATAEPSNTLKSEEGREETDEGEAMEVSDSCTSPNKKKPE